MAQKTQTKLVIDPALFTSEQWVEAFYVDADGLLKTDDYSKAKPVKASAKKIAELASYCRSKAENLDETHDEGDDMGVDDAAWATDLIQAAEVLEKIAGVQSPKRKTRIALDESELATVLAALRMFQEKYEDVSGDDIAKDWPDHFVDEKGKDIAPLGSEDIDDLCERINI